MNQQTNVRRSCPKLLAVALISIGLVGVLAIAFATSQYGPGVTTDSVHFLSCSRSLLAGEGYRLYDGAPMRGWPPLYPTLIAGLSLTGLTATNAAWVLSVVSFGLLIVLSGLWVFLYTRSSAMAVIGSLCVLVSYPLLGEYRMVWTETVFHLLIVVFLLAMSSYATHQSYKMLLVGAVAAALACLDKYMGIPVALAGCALVLFGGRLAWRKRLLHTFWFGLVALLPLTIWVGQALLSKYLEKGAIGRDQGRATSDTTSFLERTGTTFTTWALPFDLNVPIPPMAVFAVVAGALAAVVVYLWYAQLKKRDDRCAPVLSAATFAAAYLSFLLVALWRWPLSGNESGVRYLSPLYVPFVLTLLYCAWRLLSRPEHVEQPRRLLWGRRALFLVMVLWLGTNAVRATGWVMEWHGQGAGGYSQKAYQESETIAYLRGLKGEGPILTNQMEEVIYLCRRPAVLVPMKADLGSGADLSVPQFFLKCRPPNVADVEYLAWFATPLSTELCELDDLRRVFEITPVAHAADGAVYRLQRIRPVTSTSRHSAGG